MYLGRHGGGWQVISKDGEIVAEEGGMHPDEEHLIDFITSVRERKKPNGNPEQGHLSATLIHLGNIAHRVGNKQLYYDGENERFTNSDEANQYLKKEYREPYVIPENV